MCAALAPPPRCIPCSLEVDRRGVFAQGKLAAGWWSGEPGVGLVAQFELSWQLCLLPAPGRTAQCRDGPVWWGGTAGAWSTCFAVGGATGGTVPFPATLERCPGPSASSEGACTEGVCPGVGFPVSSTNSLLPRPLQHREHPHDRWPWPGESVTVTGERFPGGAAWWSQHRASPLHSLGHQK